MNATSSNTDNLTISDHPIFDPFPEPRAYPSGWDLSGLPASQPAVFKAPAPAESG